MSRTIANATLSAMMFAGAAWLLLLRHDVRRRASRNRARELRSQITDWEAEGGQIATAPAEPSSRPD